MPILNLKTDYFASLLIKWFDTNGRHNLPWQKKPSPYRVWVSEIMLQQTQVKTVIPFYKKFLKRFPEVRELSDSSLDEVLSLWSGLGYYTRARNLHSAAKIIVEKHNGILPDTVKSLMKLPGIGRSTAGAIVALSLNQCAPILDGNAKRVFCRYHAIKATPDTAQKKKKLWALAGTHLPESHFREYTQALMDLGSTICKTKSPACEHCPITLSCAACLSNTTKIFPGRTARNNRSIRSITLIILENSRGEVLLEKRPDSGIWGGLWSFPEAIDAKSAKKTVCKSHRAEILKIKRLPKFSHQFTHFKLFIGPIHFLIQDNHVTTEKSDRIWIKPDDAKSMGLPKPIRDLVDTMCSVTKGKTSWPEQ